MQKDILFYLEDLTSRIEEGVELCKQHSEEIHSYKHLSEDEKAAFHKYVTGTLFGFSCVCDWIKLVLKDINNANDDQSSNV